MYYNSFKDLKISALGMGAMRLPTQGGERISPVDEPAAHKIIRRAYEGGINYFDTAYVYHQGQSERILGEALSIYPRESYCIATKLPGHSIAYSNGEIQFVGMLAGQQPKPIEAMFEEQLARLGTDYIDFYLLHNISETSLGTYTNNELDIVNYFIKQKQAGKIRHLGFSSHGRVENIEQVLDLFPNVFEFCQIQLNYLDFSLQEAGKKYNLLTERGIPVVVMEPLRGGRLADLGDESAKLKASSPHNSVASWAFRYLQSFDNVLTTLSGMSSVEQIDDNLKTYANKNPLNDAEKSLLDSVVASLANLVPCTACRYCTDGCPAKLDIPRLLSMYNEMSFGASFSLMGLLRSMPDEHKPSACADCGVCTSQCPQGIDIPALFKQFVEKMNAPRPF